MNATGNPVAFSNNLMNIIVIVLQPAENNGEMVWWITFLVIHHFSTFHAQISLTYPHTSPCNPQNKNVILPTYQKDTNSLGFSKCHAYIKRI